MGFIAFIITMIVISEFIGSLDTASTRELISFVWAAIAAYRFTRGVIAQKKAEREQARREDLKDELRQELKEELRQEMQQSVPGSIQGTVRGSGTIQETTEEPWYPETKYFNR